MDKKYTVLKKFGSFKKGEIFDPATEPEMTEQDIAEAIEAGFIKEISEDAPEPTEKKAAKKKAVVVTYRGGTREYSEEVHGEDFMELAELFAKKFGGSIE